MGQPAIFTQLQLLEALEALFLYSVYKYLLLFLLASLIQVADDEKA